MTYSLHDFTAGPPTNAPPTPPTPRDLDGAPLGPLEALTSGFRNTGRISGRASRSAYWWFALLSNLLLWSLSFAVGIAAYTAVPDLSDSAVTGIGFLIAIPFFIAQISVAARRLHDTNQSAGWLWLLPIPYIGAFAVFVLLLMPARDPNKYTTS